MILKTQNIIDGKRYNRKTAETVILLSPNKNDDILSESLLYLDSFIQLMRKSTGEYFIYKHIGCYDEGRYYNDEIIPKSSLEDGLSDIYQLLTSDGFYLADSGVFFKSSDFDENSLSRQELQSLSFWTFNDGWLVDLIESSDVIDLDSDESAIISYIGEIESSNLGVKQSVSIMIPKVLLNYIDSHVDSDTNRTDVIVGMLSELKARRQMDFDIKEYLEL